MPNKLEVPIVADTKQYEAAMKRAQKAGSGFEQGLKKANKGALIALGALGVGAAFAVNSASNLEEQINKTSVVFGKAAPAIQAWGRTTAESLGISNRAALEAAGTFGNMLVPMGLARPKAAAMSQAMVNLAADMASFNNASPEDVLEALRSGLAGETEPLRKFGVFLDAARVKQEAVNLGLHKGKGNLDATAKAQATYSIIMKDTVDAQGDFARTSDSVANSQRVLRAQVEDTAAQLGNALLPAAKEVLNTLVGLVEFTSKHSEAAKVAAVVVGAFASAIVLANASLSIYNSGILAATRATKGLRIAMAVTPWLAAITAAGFLAEHFLKQKDAADEATEAQNDLTRAVRDFKNASKQGQDAAQELIDANLRLESSSISVKRARQDLNRVQKDEKSTILDVREAELRLAQALNERRQAVKGVDGAQAKATQSLHLGKRAADGMVQATKNLTDAYRGNMIRTEKGKVATEGIAGALNRAARRAREAGTGVNQYANKLEGMANTTRKSNPQLARTQELMATLSRAWQRVVDLPSAKAFQVTLRTLEIVERNQQTNPNHPRTRPSGGGGGGTSTTQSTTSSSRGRYTILADQEFVDHLRATDQNYRRTNGGRGIFAT